MRHSFEVSLRFTSPARAFYQDDQGELIRFSKSGSVFKSSLGTVTRQADGSAILVKKNAVRETFNSDGQLIRIEHPQGGWQTLVYDDLGRIDAITHYQGYRLQFHYDPEHKRLVRLSTSGGEDIQFRFDDKGQLTGTQLGSQGWETYRYKTIDITDVNSGDTVTQIYRLAAIVDANGVEYASWEYDHQGLAIESRHAGGAEKVTIDYQGVGSLVTNALGHQKTVINDPHGRVVEVIGGSASSEQLSSGALPRTSVDYTSRYIDMTDELGVSHKKGVNRRTGQITSVDRTYRMEGNRRFTHKTNYSWDSRFAGLVSNVRLNGMWNRAMKYDDQGRLTQMNVSAYRQPTRITTYAYNEQGLLASVDGPRTDVNDITEIKYDDRSRLSEVWVGGVLQQKVLAYDAYGRISEWQDGNGATYQQQYNHDGQLTQLRLFSTDGLVDRTTVYAYDARGLLEKVTQADGAWVQYGYDDARRLTSVSDALGNRIELTVDLAGNVTQTDVLDVNGALQRQHKAVYDQLSRLSQSIEPDAQAGEQGDLTKYDALGNAIAYTNALGTQSQSEFDALGRLSKYIDADNGETRYTYNADDQITSVTDPEGKKTEYKYSYFGDLEKIISPDTGTTTFKYDPAGNRTQSTNANNEVTTYEYDALNRLVKTTYHDNSTVEYRYDLNSSANSIGRLSEVKDRQGQVTRYHYNGAGEVIKRTLLSANNTSQAITEWHYAANGQLQALVYPSGAQLKPTYNLAGQITALHWQTNGAAPLQTVVSDVNYRAFSNAIESLTYGNGLNLQRDYELDGQLTGSRLLSTSAIDPVRQRQYTLDAINRIKAIQQQGDWGSQQHDFDYDLLSRLTQAKQHGQQDDYTYDGIGNRLSHDNLGGENPGSTTYGYASNSHQLDSIQGVNAQAVVINELGQTTQLGERQFNYDPTGHISTLTTNEGTTEYRYFPNQLRSQKIQGDQITYYDYDLQGQLISERVSHGGGTAVTTREYLWLGNELVGYYTDGQLYFVHNDHLATPQALSDSQQNKVWSLEQKAFGESILSDNQIAFNIRFPGQYYDSESGLHYNWHRYYDAELGRYLQSDPIGLNGGLSTFGYVGGNPLMYVDPNGLARVGVAPPPRNSSNGIRGTSRTYYEGNSTRGETSMREWINPARHEAISNLNDPAFTGTSPFWNPQNRWRQVCKRTWCPWDQNNANSCPGTSVEPVRNKANGCICIESGPGDLKQ
ncbi:RHS repeat protein [Bacterioplanes sanyensis]|uniref:RHS repeat protein n=1 Tax=Bacterioplanes sanyensis TaxID=1249553 RepID=UPI0016720CD1|nr:RHS repeat protein [Bacterioplanes sanyensis]